MIRSSYSPTRGGCVRSASTCRSTTRSFLRRRSCCWRSTATTSSCTQSRQHPPARAAVVDRSAQRRPAHLFRVLTLARLGNERVQACPRSRHNRTHVRGPLTTRSRSHSGCARAQVRVLDHVPISADERRQVPRHPRAYSDRPYSSEFPIRGASAGRCAACAGRSRAVRLGQRVSRLCACLHAWHRVLVAYRSRMCTSRISSTSMRASMS